ncbi:hypothetical protein DLH72_01425 [Candidatus Gracilibacteria bacterium]|nr:MAG: hypothetical protein DLH72_01425 [Candidatus Gracilibacteria bacterium]
MKKLDKKAFSIVEILVGIVIFLFGITGVYSIISSTLNINNYNKNYIIGVNLVREQLELFRNIRDTNFSKIKTYNIINPNKDCIGDGLCERFEEGYYKISNDFTLSSPFTVKVQAGEKADLKNQNSLLAYQVCIDKEGIYDYCDNIVGDKKELKLYKFIKISKVDGYDINQAMKVDSKIVWYSKGFKEFEVSSIFTDYKIY